MLPIAWREFGDVATEIESQVEATTGHRPLLVGMDPYFLSSELAFYPRHKRPDAVQSTAGRGLFGSKGLMYDYWFARTSQTGRTVIMFGSDPRGSLRRIPFQVVPGTGAYHGADRVQG